MIRIGASGWSYKEWYGTFYPRHIPQANMLKYYSLFFDTVEVNSSFYSIPDLRTVMLWNKKTDDNFVFSIKVYQGITHENRLINVSKNMLDFLERFKPLKAKGKLGAILIQLPPRFRRNFNILESFLRGLPDGYTYAIEFRNKSWIRAQTFKLLEKYNVAYVIVDEPLLPPIVKITSNIAYIRWHGKGNRIWYDYKYSRRELEEWALKVNEIKDSVDVVYGYFNNHFHGNAVKDALVMKELLGIKYSKGIEGYF